MDHRVWEKLYVHVIVISLIQTETADVKRRGITMAIAFLLRHVKHSQLLFTVFLRSLVTSYKPRQCGDVTRLGCYCDFSPPH